MPAPTDSPDTPRTRSSARNSPVRDTPRPRSSADEPDERSPVNDLDTRSVLAQTVRSPTIEARLAVGEYPALVGTYTDLRIAQLKAQQQFAEIADQQRFLSRVRQQLAEAIERGEPLSATRLPPRLRDRERFPEKTL